MNILQNKKTKESLVLLGLDINENSYEFSADIKTALSTAKLNLDLVDTKLEESIETVKGLTPECDKTDYMLAACSGAICGIMDIFLVGKPGETQIGRLTDKWFSNRTEDFAKLCGWEGDRGNVSSAISYLEKKFRIPYDQNGIGDISKQIKGLTPTNHHFKSLGHNPTIMGLFFSILDQFDNTSHFVTEGELITFSNFNTDFQLHGNSVASKLFSGFVNWFGHLLSDVSGSSATKGRGMGIPSPLWSWTNDVIAIREKLNISSDFGNSINNLALEIYKEGYDTRFQAAQCIPVFVNELLVRLLYSIRRLVGYLSITNKKDRDFSTLWKSCEPFKNASVKRMMTVAHGTFCLIDVGDACVRNFVAGGGGFNVKEFAIRLNVAGVARFTISLYGEANRSIRRRFAKENVVVLSREKRIIIDYVKGLEYLAEIYDDELLRIFTQEIKESDIYVQAFEKSVVLAEKRNVASDRILRTKKDIDEYFTKGEQDV